MWLLMVELVLKCKLGTYKNMLIRHSQRNHFHLPIFMYAVYMKQNTKMCFIFHHIICFITCPLCGYVWSWVCSIAIMVNSYFYPYINKEIWLEITICLEYTELIAFRIVSQSIIHFWYSIHMKIIVLRIKSQLSDI